MDIAKITQQNKATKHWLLNELIKKLLLRVTQLELKLVPSKRQSEIKNSSRQKNHIFKEKELKLLSIQVD